MLIHTTWHKDVPFEGTLAGKPFNNADFVKAFEAAYGVEPDEDSAIPFAVCQGIEQAITGAGSTDNAKMGEWLHARTKDDPVRTVLGRFSWDEVGLPVEKSHIMTQWQGGQLKFVYPEGRIRRRRTVQLPEGRVLTSPVQWGRTAASHPDCRMQTRWKVRRMLEVKNLCKHYGGIRAVDGATFTVEKGSITALIGPNGAGKTTAFNCISRTVAPTSGEVWLDGQRIDHLRPHKVTAKGLSRTFQISRNLSDMTVIENVIVQSRVDGIARAVRAGDVSREEKDKAMSILDFLGITRIAYEDGNNLSYGQKKLMDFAALLMSDPKIILLDEPAGGVNPSLLEEIVGHIQALNARGLTVLIVEHNMDLIMRLSHRVVVMAQGQVICDGTPDVVRKDPQVLDAYLGGVLDQEAA